MYASPVTKTSEPSVRRRGPIRLSAADPLRRDSTKAAAAPDGRRWTWSILPPGSSPLATVAARRTRTPARSFFTISTNVLPDCTP